MFPPGWPGLALLLLRMSVAFAEPLDSVSLRYSVRGVSWESHAGTIRTLTRV